MKNGPIFVDTKVLVYAHDRHAGCKQQVAARLLEVLWEGRKGRLSAQVLSELHAVLLQKFGLTMEDVAALGKAYRVWCTVDTSPALIEQGIDLMKRHQLAFFDSLIVAAVIASGSRLLLSEDFNAGQACDGIRALNPFGADFSLDLLN